MSGATLGTDAGGTLGTDAGFTLGTKRTAYTLDGGPIGSLVAERVTYGQLTLRFRVTTSVLTNRLRPLKANEGQVDRLVTDAGGYTAVDRADGANTAEIAVEEGGGTWPFTMLSAVANVRCERLNFDTDAVRQAWEADGTLSDTWLAGTEDGGTVMAYGDASAGGKSDIGLGFERAWEGYMLQGVVYASGWVAVYEDLDDGAFLRFVTETLLPHGYVPDDDDDTEQSTL